MYTALFFFCLTSGYILLAMYMVREMEYQNDNFKITPLMAKYINILTAVFTINAIGHAVYMYLIF